MNKEEVLCSIVSLACVLVIVILGLAGRAMTQPTYYAVPGYDATGIATYDNQHSGFGAGSNSLTIGDYVEVEDLSSGALAIVQIVDDCSSELVTLSIEVAHKLGIDQQTRVGVRILHKIQ